MLNLDCTHKRARHQHGTYVCYVLDKCRCTSCVTANRTYESDRRRQRAYGNQSYVDAAPARAHVEALQAAGLGWKRVAGMAGLNTSVVWALIYGKPDRGMAPSKRIRPKTAEAILAVPMPTVHDLGHGALIDATGTRRRLQALITLGWSVQRLADTHGIDRQALDNALTSDHVRVKTAVAVRTMYADQSMTGPPVSNRWERTAASRSRARAASAGWVPPLGWDDTDLDNPAATPATVERDGVRGFDLDEWIYLVTHGEHPARAATRCGVTIATVQTRAHRDGRHSDYKRALLTSTGEAG